MRFQALARGAVVTFGTLMPTLAMGQAMPSVGSARDWTVGVRVQGYYDTNVSRTSKALSDIRGLRTDDYVLTPAVTATITQPFGRQVAFLSGDVGYTFNRYNPELDRRRAAVNGGVAGILGPCRPQVVAGYDAGQSDLANLDLGTTSNLREQTRISVGATCARGTGPGGSVTLQRAETKNSATAVKESDSTTETATVQLFFARPTLGTFSIGFSHVSTEYPNRIVPGRPIGDGLFIQNYSAGYSREFGSRLSVTAQGGLSHVKREVTPPGVPQSVNSGTYGADITYGFGDRIEFSASANRSITPSVQVGKSFDKATTAGAVVRYKAGSRLQFEGGYSWQQIDANADSAIALLVVTNSETNAVYGSVAFSPNERLSVSLNVRYEERKANLPDFNYNATRVGISAQTSF